MKKNIEFLQQKKTEGIPISMTTAYDYAAACILDDSGIDAILIGDSVGTNMLGYDSEQEVSLSDMLHHLDAVARGTKRAFLIGDMPYRSAEKPSEALEHAYLFLDHGADCVKLEGWQEKHDIIEHLVKNEVVVCAHIGYNPQIHGTKPKTYGKNVEQALDLIESANILEKSGASLLVIEKVTGEVAKIITEQVKIPTIGIGCGAQCDGQVMVWNDLLGMTPKTFKHARRYLDMYNLTTDAIRRYKDDVEQRRFPSDENTWHMDSEEYKKMNDLLKTFKN